MLTCKVDFRGFDRAVKATNKELAITMREESLQAAKEGAQHARQNHRHKRRTGAATSAANLHGRLEYASQRQALAAIVNLAPHARFIEYPTKPHVIRPKEGHGFTGPLRRGQSRRAIDDIGTHRVALRWYVGGRAVFAAYVRHPGTKGFPFMRPGLRKAGDALHVGLRKRVAALNRFWK